MKKIVAILLAVIMTLGCTSGLADTTKHERVYVVAAPDGTVRSITDNIRLENADGLDEILDQTLLTDLQNVGGKQAFTLEGEALTWQASGQDITYQGTSDKTPAILPVVTLTLDGEEVTAEALRDRTGEAVLTVSYANAENLPALAVSVLPLPEEGVTDLKLENAAVLSEMGRQVLVGWAVPGIDEELKLPASFTAAFHADHTDLSWMMTLTTADPIDAVCRELDERIDLDLHAELNEAEALLTALKNGELLPETTGKTKEIAPKINELNNGLNELNNGAAALADGAAQLNDGAFALKDGAAQVNDGMATLANGAQDLKDGAAQVDAGTVTLVDGAAQLKDGAAQLNTGADSLSDALGQLSVGASQVNDGAAALSAGMVEAETGAAALNTGMETLLQNNEALNTGAQALFTAVLNAANEQLAASGLDAAGVTLPELNAENYAAVLNTALEQLDPEALQAAAYAQVEAAVRAQVQANENQVRAAVQQQLGADADKALIEAAVQAQLEQLVQENTEAYLASDETVAAKLTMAQTAAESLTALKSQLDQVNAFVAGLAAYTDGVAQAAAGVQSLQAGITQLNDGAATLAAGAEALSEGAAQAADGAVTLKTGMADLAEGAVALHTGAETLKNGTSSLAEGAGTLANGADALKDGAASLAEGASQLSDGAASLKDGAAALHEDGVRKLRDTLLDAEKKAADKLLPYVTDDLPRALRIYEETHSRAQDAGYDLRPENMKTVTVYIIRTDLQ